MINGRIYTLKEVADYLKISDNELRKLMANKMINYFEIGEPNSRRKVKRFRESDIEDFIKKNIKEGEDNQN